MSSSQNEVAPVVVRRALLSVYDKTGLVEFATRLQASGVELVSSGGTSTALAEAGLPVTRVEDVTGAAEMLGGRVKTLHPRIHGGILANLDDEQHIADLESHSIAPFELVVVNLYPFEATVADPDVTDAEAIEKIDIGGPAMVRAAAKNHAWVAVVTSPSQYETVAAAVASGGIDGALRMNLARAAFFRTAAYDAAIVGWLERGSELPERAVLALERGEMLRYGENPHQAGAIYSETGRTGWWTKAHQLQGKAMSFNNYADAEAAWRLVATFDDPACAIIKHANACGAAQAFTLIDAFTKAWACDPLSAFGSVIALNRPLDGPTGAAIAEAGFVEIVIAPDVTEDGAAALASKKNLRLLAAEPADPADPDLRRVDGGFLMQGRDTVVVSEGEWTVVTERVPTDAEWADLRFAWRTAAHTKSNAVVVVADGAAVGVGAGDQSRVGAAERALARAGDRARGGVAASDAFFPFADGVEALASRGVKAIIQPGGSKGDAAVIAAAESHGNAMVFTGRRHFRH